MNRLPQVVKAFKEMMDAELEQLNSDYGDEFARTARSAFAASHMMSLFSMAMSFSEAEANENMNEVMEGISELISSMLSDIAVTLTEDEIAKTTQWADRMMAIRNDMVMSLGGPLQ